MITSVLALSNHYRGGNLTTFTHDQFNVTFVGERDGGYSTGKFDNWTLRVTPGEFSVNTFISFAAVLVSRSMSMKRASGMIKEILRPTYFCKERFIGYNIFARESLLVLAKHIFARHIFTRHIFARHIFR